MRRVERFVDDHRGPLLVGLYGLAFCIRLAVGMGQAGRLWSQGDVSYFRIAENLVQRGEYALTPGTPTLWRGPIYPLLLALVYHLFGKRASAFITFNVLVNTLGVAATYHLASHGFGRRVAFGAALLVAFYPYLIWQSGHIIETGTLGLLLLLLVLAMLRAAETRAARWYVLAGFIGGLAALTKSAALPFLLLASAWLATGGSGRPGLRPRGAWLFVLALGLTLLPWAARNAAVSGTPRILEANGGHNLWKGNNPLTFRIYPQHSLDSIAPYEASVMPASISDDSARDRWYVGQVVEYMAREPGPFVAGVLRKTLLLYDWNLVPRSGTNATIDGASGEVIAAGRERSAGERVLYTGPYLVVGALAAVGTARCWRSRARVMAPIGLLFLSWTAVHAAVFAYTRYRMQIEPFLLILAAAGFDQVLRARHVRRDAILPYKVIGCERVLR